MKDLRSLSILNIFKIVLPFSPERKAKCCTPSMSRKFWQECIYCSAHLFNSLCCCWVERLQDFSKKISKYFVQRPGPCHATLKHEQSQGRCNFYYILFIFCILETIVDCKNSIPKYCNIIPHHRTDEKCGGQK